MSDDRIHVVWAAPDDQRPGRGYWDQALIEGMFDRSVWRPVRPFTYVHLDRFDDLPAGRGAVVVAPAAYASTRTITRATAPLPWVLLILTSDEEALFPWRQLGHHRHRKVWVQYPDLDRHAKVDGFLPVGYAPGTPDAAARHDRADRRFDWVFHGQVTNPRREAAAAAMAKMTRPGQLLATPGFAQGIPHDEYVEALSSTKAAPCPGGPFAADSFRLWEALECGAVPIVDTDAGQRPGAWHRLHPAGVPWPWVSDWAEQLPAAVDAVAEEWPMLGAECSAWWQAYKRDLTYRLDDTVAELSGRRPAPAGTEDLVTVIVPTSPIPSHPAGDVLLSTLVSLVDVGLGSCEVIVTADGVRPQQEDRRAAYEAYVWELVRTCEHRWHQVLPIVHRSHQHQARMMRDALSYVRSPLVLYLEHDAPLEGTIDWEACIELLADRADVVRFPHEAEVLDVHRHLMVGDPIEHGGARFWRTTQWSQRPHLAGADYYRRIMAEHFDPEDRWMIEDRMHSVLEVAANRRRSDEHRVWLYTVEEEGRGIRRSSHLDGRAGDPKWVDE